MQGVGSRLKHYKKSYVCDSELAVYPLTASRFRLVRSPLPLIIAPRSSRVLLGELSEKMVDPLKKGSLYRQKINNMLA